MYIREISIGKFRHMEDIKIGPHILNPKTSDLTVIAGPNGSGKSSILELIGYALSNSYSLSWSLSRTFINFSFEIAIGLTKSEKQIIIQSLKEELRPIEKELSDEIKKISENNAIEDQNKQIQIKSVEEHKLGPYRQLYEILDYFKTSDVYFRSFQYPQGEYEKNKTLHNRIHVYVTRELRNKLKRSLGFFLRPDRSYPQKTFEQKKIFSYDTIIKMDHLWTLAFNTSEIQYQDMYEFLVQQRYHYLRQLGNYYNKKNKGFNVGNEPQDPFKPYEALLQKLFPDYRFADEDRSVPTNLFIELPSKEIIPFNDLSSGEKEVFFILSFFIRHNVENAIIAIDEPELHLHPELSRLLIQNMKSIRKGNQIWIATHNCEIIDEAGRDKVIYISKEVDTQKAKITLGDNEETVIQELKKLFGFSGYIGVSKNLVFLEGCNSSADRKFFSNLLNSKGNIKFIPSSSSENITKLNSAIFFILESSLGWINFYLIRDRDYLTDEIINKYRNHKSGRIFVLKKHEIENYLINFKCLSTVLEEIFGIQKSDSELKEIFYTIAKELSSSVLRDMISFRLNLLLRPEDFSLGNFLKGQKIFSPDLSFDRPKIETLKLKFKDKTGTIRTAVIDSFSDSNIEIIIDNCMAEINKAIKTDDWLNLFPGKEMIEVFANKIGINNSISLQNSIIKEMAGEPDYLDPELIEIFNKINCG